MAELAYQGYLRPVIPTIWRLASRGVPRRQIADAVLHKIVSPPWRWEHYNYTRSWRLNAVAGNITQFLVKYPPPQQPYNPWEPKKMTIRTRPLDMGGPRDVWMTWTPYTNAAELGLLR